MEKPPPRRLRIDPSDLLLEFISIVVGVLLALALSNWVQAVQRQRTIAQSVRALVAEMDANRADVLHYAKHRSFMCEQFDELYHTSGSEHVGIAMLDATLKRVAPLTPFFPSETAWHLAQQNSIVADLPYDDQTRLADVYGRADIMRSVDLLLAGDISPAVGGHDPDLRLFVRDAALACNELAYQESAIAPAYADVIGRLRKAYP